MYISLYMLPTCEVDDRICVAPGVNAGGVRPDFVQGTVPQTIVQIII